MIDGVARIEAEQAVSKARNMKILADNIESLLNDVSLKMSEINDESVGTYHGQYKPSELRDRLDTYREQFHLFHEQVSAFSSNVEQIANKMVSQ